MSDKLDYMLMASMRKESGINILEASTFVLGLRKMAQDAAPIDITGTIEGQFTVPLDQAISLMAQMVSNEFKTQAYYVYYGNMLRGTDRAGIAEEFEDHAKDELEHANYLLRRIGVLSPGGISIPPYPPPRPLYNSQQIIREMIVVEQIGLSLWKQLHSILGDNPMKYTVEQFLQTEEAHQDELWQFLDPMAPEQQMDEAAAMPEAPKTAAEIFAAAAVRKQAAQSVLSEHSDHPGSMMVSNLKRLADQSKQLSAAVSVQDNAEPWVESKIDRASEGIDAVHDYMKYKSEKKASHALSADEMATAGWDRSRAGKKEHSVKEAQAAQSMGKPTVPEHDELVRAGMDKRDKEKNSYMIIPVSVRTPTEYGKAKAEIALRDMPPEEREAIFKRSPLFSGVGGGAAGAATGIALGTLSGMLGNDLPSNGELTRSSLAGGLALGGLGALGGYAYGRHRKAQALRGEVPSFGHLDVLDHLDAQSANRLREQAGLPKQAAKLPEPTVKESPVAKKAMMDPEKLKAHLAAIKKPVQQAAAEVSDPHALQKARAAARQLVGSGAGGMIHTASDNSEGDMDRDKVIKDKARELMAKATSGYRSLADMIHHKDQARTEVTPTDPAALQKQQAPFVVKTNPAVVRPQDPESHTPVPMRGPLPMPKQASLGDLVLKSASFAPRKTHEYDTLGGRKEIGHRDTLGGWVPDSAPSESGMIGKLLRMRNASGAAKIADMIVPTPGADNPEAYVMREQQLIAQQAQGEAAHQKAISAQASQAAQQAQSEAQAAQQQLQEMQQQLQEAQQQAEQASQQQTQSAQQAAEAEARAADHSIQKMQLGMRVNQLRQSLANLVMQDPVSENSGTVSDLAATGQPATPQQQQEAEAQQQQAQAAPPSAGTQQQEAEAQNAQQDAQVQEQQAQQAQAQDQAKQSGLKFAFLGGVAERAARSATRGALEEAKGHAPELGRLVVEGAGAAARDKLKQYAPHLAGAALLTAGGAGLAAKASKERRKEDIANAVAEGIRRSKTAAPADLNMARAIHAMEEGPLREQLMSVIKQKMPGTAARAAVHNAANAVVDEVKQEAPKVIAEGGKSLYEKARPHLPGFVAGLGTAYVGSKLLGGGQPEQPQQASPLTYAQYYSGQG
jgi:bacterioferritin (cytochrome b1)